MIKDSNIKYSFTEDSFNAKKYEVVFGIISKYDNKLPHIPFFSKITFKTVATNLINLGYKVSLKAIKNTYVGDNKQTS